MGNLLHDKREDQFALNGTAPHPWDLFLLDTVKPTSPLSYGKKNGRTG